MKKRWTCEDKFDKIIRNEAIAYALPFSLIKAVIAKESSFNTYAIRPEPGFFKAYFDNLKALVTRTRTKRDDHWFKFSHIFSCSYCLMQVMYSTALELGFRGDFPTALCEPIVGISYGCKYLRSQLDYSKTRFDSEDEITAGALAAYNGGRGAIIAKLKKGGPFRNQYYVDKVLEFKKYFEGKR